MNLWNGKLTIKGYIWYVGGVGEEVGHGDGRVNHPGTQQLQQTYPGLEPPALQKYYTEILFISALLMRTVCTCT